MAYIADLYIDDVKLDEEGRGDTLKTLRALTPDAVNGMVIYKARANGEKGKLYSYQHKRGGRFYRRSWTEHYGHEHSLEAFLERQRMYAKFRDERRQKAMKRREEEDQEVLNRVVKPVLQKFMHEAEDEGEYSPTVSVTISDVSRRLGINLKEDE